MEQQKWIVCTNNYHIQIHEEVKLNKTCWISLVKITLFSVQVYSAPNLLLKCMLFTGATFFKLVLRYPLVKEGVFAPGGHFWLTHVKDRFYFIVMAWRPEILICDACLVYYSYS